MSKVSKLASGSSVKQRQQSVGFTLPDNSVSTEHLVDSIITTEKLEDGVVTEDKLDAAVTVKLAQTGDIEPWLFSTIKAGWLNLNGQTIGSVASGATYAAADAEALFILFWNDFDNTALPILDSAGAGSTRGASAVADFAANKRLPVFNAEGLVARGTGTQSVSGNNKVGPSVGEKQADQLGAHTHGTSSATSNSQNGSLYAAITINASDNVYKRNATGNFVPQAAGSNGEPVTHGGGAETAGTMVGGITAISNATTSETRGAAFGIKWIIKL